LDLLKSEQFSTSNFSNLNFPISDFFSIQKIGKRKKWRKEKEKKRKNDKTLYSSKTKNREKTTVKQSSEGSRMGQPKQWMHTCRAQ
jgi:hypothetical protein